MKRVPGIGQSSAPIHPELLPELKAAKRPNTGDERPVFTRCNNADRMIRRHIAAAKIARIDAMGPKLVFHSLRNTFAPKLAVSGVSQRLTQELMRHSDPRLTANIYTDVTRLPTFDAVRDLAWHAEKLATLSPGFPPATDTQLHPQNLGAARQNVTQPDVTPSAAIASASAGPDAICAVLTLPDTGLKVAEETRFQQERKWR